MGNESPTSLLASHFLKAWRNLDAKSLPGRKSRRTVFDSPCLIEEISNRRAVVIIS